MDSFFHAAVLTIGFAGQFCYFMRMLWQWIVSERRKQSVLPLGFWYWSLGGSVLLLTYAVLRRDPVFILGQLTGFVVYTRNLILWRSEDGRAAPPATSSPMGAAGAHHTVRPPDSADPVSTGQTTGARAMKPQACDEDTETEVPVRGPIPLDVVEYSLVAPCYNEAGNLAEFVREWHGVLTAVGRDFEIIVVDDASTDESFEVLRGLAETYPELRAVRLAARSGQSAALLAGIHVSRGRWIITSDSDLQNDPGDFPRLLEAAKDADLVCGWRKNRQDPAWKKWVSRLANWYRSRHLADGVHDTGCGLKLMKREVALSLLPFDGVHRFIPALALIEGFRVTEVVVNHRPRVRERSKYTFFNRLVKPIQDLRGVAWYRARRVHFRIAEEVSGAAAVAIRRSA